MPEAEDAEVDPSELKATGIARVPNLFLLDTSASMNTATRNKDGVKERKIEQVNGGLKLFTEEIGNDPKSEMAIDVSTTTFGGDVQIEQGFAPIGEVWLGDQNSPPKLEANGGTPMCEGIETGLKHLVAYTGSVDDEGIPRKKALVWLLTDGAPNNGPGTKNFEQAQNIIERGAEDGHLFFYAVGIGDDADMDTLEELISGVEDDSKVFSFQLDDDQFADFFKAVSDSASDSVHGGSESAEDAIKDSDSGVGQI